jgi:hypothetical protein
LPRPLRRMVRFPHGYLPGRSAPSPP